MVQISIKLLFAKSKEKNIELPFRIPKVTNMAKIGSNIAKMEPKLSRWGSDLPPSLIFWELK